MGNFTCFFSIKCSGVNLQTLSKGGSGVCIESLFLHFHLRLSGISQLLIPLFTIFSNPMNGNSSDHSSD